MAMIADKDKEGNDNAIGNKSIALCGVRVSFSKKTSLSYIRIIDDKDSILNTSNSLNTSTTSTSSSAQAGTRSRRSNLLANAIDTPGASIGNGLGSGEAETKMRDATSREGVLASSHTSLTASTTYNDVSRRASSRSRKDMRSNNNKANESSDADSRARATAETSETNASTNNTKKRTSSKVGSEVRHSNGGNSDSDLPNGSFERTPRSLASSGARDKASECDNTIVAASRIQHTLRSAAVCIDVYNYLDGMDDKNDKNEATYNDASRRASSRSRKDDGRRSNNNNDADDEGLETSPRLSLDRRSCPSNSRSKEEYDAILPESLSKLPLQHAVLTSGNYNSSDSALGNSNSGRKARRRRSGKYDDDDL